MPFCVVARIWQPIVMVGSAEDETDAKIKQKSSVKAVAAIVPTKVMRKPDMIAILEEKAAGCFPAALSRLVLNSDSAVM
jgi:hypothetical protein